MHAFRAGTPAGASYDFIPSRGAPAYLQPENIVGEQAPDSVFGLRVSGSLGPALLVEHEFIPQGYVIVLATSGLGVRGTQSPFGNTSTRLIVGCARSPAGTSAIPSWTRSTRAALGSASAIAAPQPFSG